MVSVFPWPLIRATSSNPTGIENPFVNDNASLIAHYSDFEHVTDDSAPAAEGEAPPAYHQLTIEGDGGNVLCGGDAYEIVPFPPPSIMNENSTFDT